MSTEPSRTPRTARGNRTRTKILTAAEQIFASVGYHEASIVKITEAAEVGLGTFYLYFGGKKEIFDEVVEDLNHRVRQAMTRAANAEANRMDAERAGFRAFFEFTAEHPALYRIIRQAEFVSPGALKLHYSRIVEGYIQGLKKAQASGDVRKLDAEVVAWALMGVGEIIGMRWVLWGPLDSEAALSPSSNTTNTVPEDVFNTMMEFIERGLAPDETERKNA